LVRDEGDKADEDDDDDDDGDDGGGDHDDRRPTTTTTTMYSLHFVKRRFDTCGIMTRFSMNDAARTFCEKHGAPR
jgi:hypothetical protein